MMEVVSGDNWSYKTCKAPVELPTPINLPTTNFLQVECSSCRQTHSVQALTGKHHSIFFHSTVYPCSPQ